LRFARGWEVVEIRIHGLAPGLRAWLKLYRRYAAENGQSPASLA